MKKPVLGRPFGLFVQPDSDEIRYALQNPRIIISTGFRREMLGLLNLSPPKGRMCTRTTFNRPSSIRNSGMATQVNQCLEPWARLWFAVALVRNQENGGDGDLDMFYPNILLGGNKAIEMTFTEDRVWLLNERSCNHVFPERTVMVSLLPLSP